MINHAERILLFTVSLCFVVITLAPNRVDNVSAAANSTQQPVPRYETTPCDFPLPTAIPQDVNRECGLLVVSEVRGRANGRTFRLGVVIYRAKKPDGSPALLLLHGGPGGLSNATGLHRETTAVEPLGNRMTKRV